MILIVDNYDSFTYNLVQYAGATGAEVRTVRNDAFTVNELPVRTIDGIILSPGPGTPSDAGRSGEVIRRYAGRIPMLGVCLGHQCIGAAFGAEVGRADRLMHGKTSLVHHDGTSIFRDLPSPLNATRYHSLMVNENTLPEELSVTARTERGELMGIRHDRWPLEGIQFHPESIMTDHGFEMIRTFTRACRRADPPVPAAESEASLKEKSSRS